MRIGFRVLAVVGMIGVVVLGSHASASGFFNMPTSLRQCLGVGFGAGYHAPLLLGPVHRAPTASQSVIRVRQPFAPAGHTGFTQPSRLGLAHPPTGHGYSDPYAAGYPMPATTETYAWPTARQPSFQAPMPATPTTTYQGHEVIPAPEPAR